MYILSALHGLVELDEVIAPYDHRLGDRAERETWARRIATRLIDRHGEEVSYLILAGAAYAEPLAAELRPPDGRYRGQVWGGVVVPAGRPVLPLRRLTIGGRLRFLARAAGGAA